MANYRRAFRKFVVKGIKKEVQVDIRALLKQESTIQKSIDAIILGIETPDEPVPEKSMWQKFTSIFVTDDSDLPEIPALVALLRQCLVNN